MFINLYMLSYFYGYICIYWKLTSYIIDFISSIVSLAASFLGVSFPPLRSLSSLYVVFVHDGPTPLVFLLRLKFLVLERKLKGHTQMLAWPSPFEISCACITFHFFYTFYRPFQYFFEQYPILHPTIDLHIFLPLTMPWVLHKTKYSAFWIHYFPVKTLS